MNKEKYITLIFKKLKGAISLEEQSILDVWIGQSAENEQVYKELESDWGLTKNYESKADVKLDVEADFQLLKQRIQLDESHIQSQQDKLRVAHQPIGKVVLMKTQKSSRTWIGWAAAAAIALAVGFWFINNQDNATTLDLIALETTYQERKEVQLADGTKVWLNGDSKLSYPTTFDDSNRLVKLTGEAFFDVTKNPSKPFIIETNKAKVTVLGTSFNVRARLAETKTEVLVQTGKVRLENTAGDKKVELTPNQKGTYLANENEISKISVADLNDLAWHTDKILFKATPVAEVVEVLEDLFDVTVAVKNPNLLSCPWDGFYKIGDGATKILGNLATDLEMELKPVGNTNYELIGGKCQE